MGTSDETDEANPVAARLDHLADSCSALADAWQRFGTSHISRPPETSRIATDVRQFESFNGPTPRNVGYAAGQFAGLYVDSIAQHVLALEALIRSRRVAVAPWPIVRACLEIAGRVAWLLEPDLGDRSGERRVARFYLESIASLQRDRFTLGRYDRAQAKVVKRIRDSRIAEAVEVYGELELDLSEIESIATWTIHDEPSIGLGPAVQLFTNLCFTEARGLYDHLSDYSHPSLLALTRQTTASERDGVTSRDWTVDVSTIEHQTRLACLVLYKAAQVIADYYGSDAGVLERWADAAPLEWFNIDVD